MTTTVQVSRRTPPLVIVGSGIPGQAGVKQFLAFIARVRARAGASVDVEGGLIGDAPPTVGEAVSRLLGGEGTPGTPQCPLAVVPLRLTAGGNGKGGVADSMAREQAVHPGLTCRYAPPLGPHPMLQDVLEARIEAALGGADRVQTHVVLVGRGSTDPDSNAEVARAARLLWEGRGYAAVEHSFASLAEPSVPAALERVRRLGARIVVVAPYFLFAGTLPDRIAQQSKGFAAVCPELDVRVADLIGDCDELADLVLERYREAVTSDTRVTCGTGAPQVSLPGVDDEAARPRGSSYHPDGENRQRHAGDAPCRPLPVGDRRSRESSSAGQVWLVGGGPGADDLITVRGQRLLDTADVIVADRLAPQYSVTHPRKGVILVDAAKHPRGSAMPQEEINRIMIEHARAGRRVVRLKGGDPFVFGRGHEELEACIRAGVACEVVPGVPSAIAVPAAAAVPVTHRGMTQEFVVVSGHVPPDDPASRVDWDTLARLTGSLVVLMGVASMPAIAAKLVQAGRSASTPVLIVENGFGVKERVLTSTLSGVAEVLAAERIAPPAVFVIGDVVRRREVIVQAGAVPSTGRHQ